MKVLPLTSLLALAPVTPAFASEGEGGGGGLLTVDGGLLIWTLVVFGLLFLILKKYAWPQILGAVEAREAALEKQLADATAANQQAQALLAEHQKLVADSRASAQALMAEAAASAEKERVLAVEKTRQEQDDLMARARRELQAEQERAVAELRREAVDLSLAAATRLIGQRLDSAADRALVESYLKTVEKAN
jgi:F-type H+-transporting ATPase subunit b